MIETLEPLAGELPARALRLVQEWGRIHRAELEANWGEGGGTRAVRPRDRSELLVHPHLPEELRVVAERLDGLHGEAPPAAQD